MQQIHSFMQFDLRFRFGLSSRDDTIVGSDHAMNVRAFIDLVKRFSFSHF